MQTIKSPERHRRTPWNRRGLTRNLLVVGALAASSCSGGGDESSVRTFCETIASLDETADPSAVQTLQLFQASGGLYVEFQSDGPERSRDELSDLADAGRKIVDLDSGDLEDIDDELDDEAIAGLLFGSVDEDLLEGLTPEVRENVENFASFTASVFESSQGFGDEVEADLEEFVQESCGDLIPEDELDPSSGEPEAQNTERIPGTREQAEDEASGADDPPPTVATVPPDPPVFTETVDGPFGGGVISNVDMEIDSAEWSNLRPERFGTLDDSVPLEDGDGRILYLTIDLDNQDPNDSVPLRGSVFTLVDADGEYPSQEAGEAGSMTDDVDPATSQTRTYGFDVGEVIDLSQATVEYRSEGLPGSFGVFESDEAEADDGPYPISVEPPAPLEYIGNLAVGCDVVYTWTVDDASASIDLPAPLALELPHDGLRSQPGTRWLRLTGAITTDAGTGSCSVPSGNVNLNFLQLVVDGRTMEPSGAPNVIVNANETVELDLYWPIPVDAQSLTIRAQGRDGLTEEIPITIPDLPAVDGD